MSLEHLRKMIRDTEEQIRRLSTGSGTGTGLGRVTASGSTERAASPGGGSGRRVPVNLGGCKGRGQEERRRLPALPPRKPVIEPRPFDGRTSFRDFLLQFS